MLRRMRKNQVVMKGPGHVQNDIIPDLAVIEEF